MDERAIQIRVGMLIVATVAIGVLMLFLFGGFPNVLVGNYTVYVKFPQAPGVTPNTSVRKNGVKIGTVTNVELPDEGGVLVTLVIDGNRRLYVNEVCHISTGTLLGDAVIEFVPSGVRGEELKHGEYISGVVAGDPLKVLVSLEDNMTRALRSIEDAGGEVQQLARSMDQVLVTNRDQFQRVVQKSELALDSIRTTMENIDDFVGDDELRARLKKSLEELPELLTEARHTFGQARQTLAGMERTSQRAEANLQNLERFTRPLGDRGEQIVGNVDSSIRKLDELLAQLVNFSDALNTSEGSLGRFVHDPELYDRLDRAAANVEEVSRKLRPIVDDVRVFTDKVSRHPGVILRDAVRPGPGIK